MRRRSLICRRAHAPRSSVRNRVQTSTKFSPTFTRVLFFLPLCPKKKKKKKFVWTCWFRVSRPGLSLRTSRSECGKVLGTLRRTFHLRQSRTWTRFLRSMLVPSSLGSARLGAPSGCGRSLVRGHAEVCLLICFQSSPLPPSLSPLLPGELGHLLQQMGRAKLCRAVRDQNQLKFHS